MEETKKEEKCLECAGKIQKGKNGFKGFGGGRYSPYCICINGKNPFRKDFNRFKKLI